jgi:hypothetical protein
MSGLSFHSESARNKGRQLHSTFHVEGGEIDTSVVEALNNVTLTHQGGGTYVLVIEADSQQAKAVRNGMVYNALLRKFCDGNDGPYNRLVQQDKDERS